MKWISVEDRLPKPQCKVIAFYLNSQGNRRTIMAFHVPALTIHGCDFYDWECDFELDYVDGEEEGYVQESWHESIDNWDDYSSVHVCEGDITHWIPIPDPPEDK